MDTTLNLTCYLVDDEFHAIDVLRSYIEKTPGLTLKGASTDPGAALQQVIAKDPPRLTFLDIDMPELSGMEFAGMVSLYTKVIFTTSFPEYAIEAFEKEAFDYLLKPISYERFLKTITTARKNLLETEKIRTGPANYFYIKSDTRGKLLRVTIAEIVFVEALQNYVRIHCQSDKFTAYLTMEEVAEWLPKNNFIRVHRSFIINADRIKALENGQVTLDNMAVISLGRLYREPLLTSMNSLLLQSKRQTG
jgi:DNA-binding LytR/AlgR family response regulator